MKKINKEKKKGFTLVEMLAVVVILALLVGLSVPIVSKIISNARINTVLSSYDTVITNIRTDLLLTGTLNYSDYNSDNLTISAGTHSCETNYESVEMTITNNANLTGKCPSTANCNGDKIYVCVSKDSGEVKQTLTTTTTTTTTP